MRLYHALMGGASQKRRRQVVGGWLTAKKPPGPKAPKPKSPKAQKPKSPKAQKPKKSPKKRKKAPLTLPRPAGADGARSRCPTDRTRTPDDGWGRSAPGPSL